MQGRANLSCNKSAFVQIYLLKTCKSQTLWSRSACHINILTSRYPDTPHLVHFQTAIKARFSSQALRNCSDDLRGAMQWQLEKPDLIEENASILFYGTDDVT